MQSSRQPRRPKRNLHLCQRLLHQRKPLHRPQLPRRPQSRRQSQQMRRPLQYAVPAAPTIRRIARACHRVARHRCSVCRRACRSFRRAARRRSVRWVVEQRQPPAVLQPQRLLPRAQPRHRRLRWCCGPCVLVKSCSFCGRHAVEMSARSVEVLHPVAAGSCSVWPCERLTFHRPARTFWLSSRRNKPLLSFAIHREKPGSTGPVGHLKQSSRRT